MHLVVTVQRVGHGLALPARCLRASVPSGEYLRSESQETGMSKLNAQPAAANWPEDNSVSILDQWVGYNLHRAYLVQLQRFKSILGPLNIRPVQMSILGLMYDNRNITQAELRTALDVQRSNIVTLLDDLEQRGLVRRRQSTSDKRARVLTLSPEGRRLARKVLDLHAQLERNIEESLGKHERDELLKLLRAFRRLDPSPELG